MIHFNCHHERTKVISFQLPSHWKGQTLTYCKGSTCRLFLDKQMWGNRRGSVFFLSVYAWAERLTGAAILWHLAQGDKVMNTYYLGISRMLFSIFPCVFILLFLSGSFYYILSVSNSSVDLLMTGMADMLTTPQTFKQTVIRKWQDNLDLIQCLLAKCVESNTDISNVYLPSFSVKFFLALCVTHSVSAIVSKIVVQESIMYVWTFVHFFLLFHFTSHKICTGSYH